MTANAKDDKKMGDRGSHMHMWEEEKEEDRDQWCVISYDKYLTTEIIY